jgi:hypothetical protein
VLRLSEGRTLRSGLPIEEIRATGEADRMTSTVVIVAENSQQQIL